MKNLKEKIKSSLPEAYMVNDPAWAKCWESIYRPVKGKTYWQLLMNVSTHLDT